MITAQSEGFQLTMRCRLSKWPKLRFMLWKSTWYSSLLWNYTWCILSTISNGSAQWSSWFQFQFVRIDSIRDNALHDDHMKTEMFIFIMTTNWKGTEPTYLRNQLNCNRILVNFNLLLVIDQQTFSLGISFVLFFPSLQICKNLLSQTNYFKYSMFISAVFRCLSIH